MGPDLFDAAIIGAGVTGVATARRLALSGQRVLLLEKSADILSGASKANSALLHPGFDAPEGSLELACMQAGYGDYLKLRHAMNLPLLETGAMVVAWTAEQAAALPETLATAHRNGVTECRLLTSAEISARESNLATARAAVLVPGEHVIDPWSPFHGYAIEILGLGGTILRQTEVIGGRYDGSSWQIDTSRGAFHASAVVNCAGLYGDRIDAAFLGRTDFTIKPRKGQFVVFDKAAAGLLNTIILPVPDARTKGVVLTPTIFGNLLVGPTAEETPDRDRPTTTPEALRQLISRAVEILPALAEMPITATYAGLRPATEFKEYCVHHDPARHWVTVGGIRSTGLTAALGIAQHVEALLALPARRARTTPPPHMPNFAEHERRDWQAPHRGEIICHCEMVTRREVEAALSSRFPPADFGGLQRRTRCAMGRCQGFNCLGALEEITRGRLALPIAAPQ